MMTIQGMRMRTNMLMEQMRIDAIDDTFKKWQDALRKYYTDGYDNGESVQLYKELVKLGTNEEALIDEEFKIREEILGI